MAEVATEEPTEACHPTCEEAGAGVERLLDGMRIEGESPQWDQEHPKEEDDQGFRISVPHQKLP